MLPQYGNDKHEGVSSDDGVGCGARHACHHLIDNLRRRRSCKSAGLGPLEAWKVDKAPLRKLTTSILAEAVSREYTDYAGAEQGDLSNLLATVENPDAFNPDRAKKSFKRL